MSCKRVIISACSSSVKNAGAVILVVSEVEGEAGGDDEDEEEPKEVEEGKEEERDSDDDDDVGCDDDEEEKDAEAKGDENHPSNSSLDENISGNKKFRRLHSSARLFCKGVPVKRSRCRHDKDERVENSFALLFFSL
jgi:hypothetical protein